MDLYNKKLYVTNSCMFSFEGIARRMAEVLVEQSRIAWFANASEKET